MRGLGNHRNAFSGQSLCDGKGSVTWGDVMMDHPFFCNVWSHPDEPFSDPFKDVSIKKNLVDSVTGILKTIPFEDVQHCYQKWKQRFHWCVAAQGNYLEGDNIDV